MLSNPNLSASKTEPGMICISDNGENFRTKLGLLNEFTATPLSSEHIF